MQQIQGLNISPNMIQQLCEKMLDPTITWQNNIILQTIEQKRTS